jgi:copper(I)-binding protein
LDAVTRTLRRATLAAATVFAVGALAGCGVGFNAQTNLVKSSEGAEARAGDIVIRNAQLVSGGPDGSTAALVVGLVNEGETADALTDIRVNGGTAGGTAGGTTTGTGATESTLPPGGLELPPGELVSIGSQNGPSVMLRTAPGTLPAGSFVRLSLNFRTAGLVQLTVVVQDRVGPYATVSVSPPAGGLTPGDTGTPAPTESPSPPATPAETPSPTPATT